MITLQTNHIERTTFCLWSFSQWKTCLFVCLFFIWMGGGWSAAAVMLTVLGSAETFINDKLSDKQWDPKTEWPGREKTAAASSCPSLSKVPCTECSPVQCLFFNEKKKIQTTPTWRLPFIYLLFGLKKSLETSHLTACKYFYLLITGCVCVCVFMDEKDRWKHLSEQSKRSEASILAPV